MSPERIRTVLNRAIELIREHANDDGIIVGGDIMTGDDIVADLKRAESTIYRVCEAGKPYPLCETPAGFERMVKP